VFSSDQLSRHLHRVGDIDVPTIDRDARQARTRKLLLLASEAADEQERQRLHDEVVLLNVEIAESIVMRYRNRGVPAEDLVQVACLGLVKSARGFNPAKSENFLSYAVPTILGEVKRFFRDNAWVVRPPRRIQELQAEISAASAALAHAEGRVPSVSDIACSLEVDSKDVEEALAADGCFTPSSLDRPTVDGESASLNDVLGRDEAGYEQAEAVVALAPICRNLSERDRRIIYLRFFHEWTQARIAAEFGVTQMQVSRLLTRILKQLRNELGDADLAAIEEPTGIAV
jgi:RNA polymerase sigma-B factor